MPYEALGLIGVCLQQNRPSSTFVKRVSVGNLETPHTHTVLSVAGNLISAGQHVTSCSLETLLNEQLIETLCYNVLSVYWCHLEHSVSLVQERSC